MRTSRPLIVPDVRRRLAARALGVVALAAAAVAPRAHELTPFPDVVEQVRPSIVGVGTFLPTRRPPAVVSGTGFSVGAYIVTNAHVVEGDLDLDRRERLVVFIGRGREADVRDATIVARDARHDLAVLRIDGPRVPGLSLGAAADVREGDAIAFTGYPIGAVLGLFPVTHHGIVSAVTPIAIPANRANELTADQVLALRDPYLVFQLDATAYPGNSGSPVYRRENGQVIGVVNRVFVKSTKENVLKDPSNITYAIPVRYVKALLETVP